MATWDSADLLQRVKDKLLRPSTDALFDNDRIYRELTEAEAHWKPVIAAHYPNDMFSAPAAMTDNGDGTYSFPASETDPLALMILRSTTGMPMLPGAYFDREADYVLEEGGIRLTAGREQQSFPDGVPYVRVVSSAGTIDASTDSGIKPARVRILLVYSAAGAIVRSGMGLGDPSFFEEKVDELAWGVPGTGDVGMVGALKLRDRSGRAAWIGRDEVLPYWRPEG